MNKGLLIFVLLLKCSPNFKVKDNFDKYQKTFIEKSKYAPSIEEIERDKKINIVIFDFDFLGISDNDKQNDAISQYAASKLGAILSETGYINVLDRNLLKKASKEISLKEVNGNFQYSGPREAQYGIYGKITNMTFSNQFDARTGANVFMNVAKIATVGTMMANRRGRGSVMYVDANRHSSIPGVYKYTAIIGGELQIVDLKTMHPITKIQFEQQQYQEENASTTSGDIKPPKTFDAAMFTEALGKVFLNSKRTILNTIPIVAYVTGRMDLPGEKKPIFKINVGAEYGIHQKWNLACELIKEQTNDLTGKIELQKDIILGYTTDMLSQDSCFIVFDKLKDANNVKAGDKCLIAPDIRQLKSYQ